MYVVALVLVVAVLPLFAGGGQGQPSGGAAAPGKTEIRAAWWGDTKRHELYNQIIDEFQKVNPDITVVREPTSFNDYWDKLSVQVAGGNAPDFLCMHPRFAADYIPRGVCEVLDPYIADGTLSTKGWAQSVIDAGKYEGKIYMMAMGVTFNACFINLGAFKELGVTPPGFEWSWEDLKRIGIQIRAALDRQGKKTTWMINDLTIDADFNAFRYFVRERGREQYNADGSIGFTQKDIEDWFAMFKEFRDLGIIPDAATSIEYFSNVLEDSLFGRDKVFLRYIPVNQFWLYNSTFPNKELGIVRQSGSAGNMRPGEFPEGAHFAANAKSVPARKLAAVKLINFWVNDPKSLVLFKLDQGVPGNADQVQKAVMPVLDQYQLAAVNFVNTLSKITTSSPNPPIGASEIAQEYLKAAQEVAFGAKTPAVAAKEFYDRAVAIRTNANK
ncbi:MAG: ABC transporter substrate-binding protein [Treponema sp.]|nr:ABC transporter substrate-binding protein [Treponema sp.]